MVILVAAVLTAILLLWFGFVRSHWIAPAALFCATGPVIAAVSWSDGIGHVALFLLANLSLFYAAFALGRTLAGRETQHG